MTALSAWLVRVGNYGVNLNHVTDWYWKAAGEQSTLTLFFTGMAEAEDGLTLRGDDAFALMVYLHKVAGDAYATKGKE